MYTPSNGAVYPDISNTQHPIASNLEQSKQHDIAANMSGTGASPQYNSGGDFSSYQWWKYMTTEQNQRLFNLQQEVLAQHEHTTPYGPTLWAQRNAEVVAVRSFPDYQMNGISTTDTSDNSSTAGGKSVDADTQPAQVNKDVEQPPPPALGGLAPAQSTARTSRAGPGQGLASNGALGGVSTHKERQSASRKFFSGSRKTVLSLLGVTSDTDEDELLIAEKFQSKIEALEKGNADLEKRYTGAEKSARDLEEAGKMKDDELERLRAARKLDQSQIASLQAKLQDITDSNARSVNARNSEVAHLRTDYTNCKAMVDKLTMQLSSLEQSNSKSVGGTGAHKDSHAIPPNLVKSVFIVNEVALTFTKTFITFLKDQKVFDHHVALQSVPAGADDRSRKYAFQAYVCSRLFAGFENDRYVDSLDNLQGSPYLPAHYEEADFFLKNQDRELRHQQYLAEYDELQQLGLQGVMEKFKADEGRGGSFSTFCCRKLVNITGVDGLNEEFPRDGDYSKSSLLYQLANNPKYCDKFLKPFVNLALVAFLLHRLVFQFNPPPRIFRYARGTKFDPTYMESAVPIDDDVSVVEFIVGLVLVPGFQVGATIIKCTVYLVKYSAPPSGGQAS